MPESLPYRDFYYPLNVFMHILTLEEGEVRHLHYGLFDHEGERIGDAQERAADLVFANLPSPPARILDVGSGLGTTLARLTRMGYDAEGITPDARQIETIRLRHGDAVRVHCARFEGFISNKPFDSILFHESSQYINSRALFSRARDLASSILVFDEFATGAVEGLHRYDEFLAAATEQRFELTHEEDVSHQAASTIDYFMSRLPRFRDRLIADLSLTPEQLDDLLSSGASYREFYRTGAYAYRLMCFAAAERARFSAIRSSGERGQG